MNVKEVVRVGSHWVFIAPLLVLLLGLLYILIKRHREEHAMAKLVKKALEKHQASKKDAARLEQLGRHHLTVLLNEGLFVIALIVTALGVIYADAIVIAIGFAVMLLTLYLLRIIMAHPAAEPAHHLLDIFEKKGMGAEEELVHKHVHALLHKEQVLKKKEIEIGKQLESLYKLAIELEEKERALRVHHHRALKHTDRDVEHMLGKVDDLLRKMPDAEVVRFVRSESFPVYQRVMRKLGKA